MNDRSILFNTLTESQTELGATGTTPTGMPFIYSISESGLAHPALGMYSVSLPFTTSTHLLALPKRSQYTYSFVSIPHELEPVELEGDYMTYFSLYAGQSEQIDSRVMLNPRSMEFSLEFCQTYAWEITDGTLSFLSLQTLPDLRIVDAFIQLITPAAAPKPSMQLTDRPQTSEQLSSTASRLLCPVCRTPLRRGKSWLACPSGHGYLLTASELVKTRQHRDDMGKAMEAAVKATPKVVYQATVTAHGDLTCPNDGVFLQKAQYQETSASLYVCNDCIYRWIDGQDLDTILGPYRNDSEDQVEESDERPLRESSWNQNVDARYLRRW